MNKKVLTLGLMLMAGLGANAQVSLVNPVPQEVTATENAIFDAPATWSINTAKAHQSGYIYDALMTASPEVAKKANFKVTLGVRGESQVSKYKKNIPAKSEGYFMKVTEKEVVIAGNDETSGRTTRSFFLSAIITYLKFPLVTRLEIATHNRMLFSSTPS